MWMCASHATPCARCVWGLGQGWQTAQCAHLLHAQWRDVWRVVMLAQVSGSSIKQCLCRTNGVCSLVSRPRPAFYCLQYILQAMKIWVGPGHKALNYVLMADMEDSPSHAEYFVPANRFCLLCASACLGCTGPAFTDCLQCAPGFVKEFSDDGSS